MTGTVLSGAHVLALTGVLFGAVAQSATGMGFSLMAAPVLILYLGPRTGIAATVALAALSSVAPLVRDGRHARPREVGRLLVPMLACTPVIALILHRVDTRPLALIAGCGVIASVSVLAGGVRWRWLRHPLGAMATGGASALLNVVGGVGGPPIGLYAANAEWEPAKARANLHCVFLLQNLATSMVLGIRLPGIAEMLALAAGTGLGMALAPRVPIVRVRQMVLGVSLLGGITLVCRAV
ncbi:sulfite exporter TauE/SafE family protein [Nocardia aurantiaca]|uniref:Probable membrane transporter protein n=1 Tax=Nocardia aurantiaca TaxID=2675850 RepID=A0A6I3KRD5_9NOCA|nr:TSUP family transporter [Nocardia aurantiaca]